MFLQDLLAVFDCLIFCLKVVPLYHDALAAGEAIRFYDNTLKSADKFFDSLKRRECPEAGISGNIVFFQQISCESLRCFQSCQALCRTHGWNALIFQEIDNAVVQGIFRTYYREIDAVFPRELSDFLHVVIALYQYVIRKRRDAGIVGFHAGKEGGIVCRPLDRLRYYMLPGAVSD